MKKIRIRSKKDGFRRAGMAHPAEWTEYPASAFTPEQLEAIKAEPMLQVEEFEAEAKAEEPKAKAEGKADKGKKD